MSRSNENSSRRQQILTALATMLEAGGNTRITTAALAREVGVSEAALYRHFPSKTRMFEGLLDFTEDALFSRINEIRREGQTTEVQCYRTLALLLAFCEKNPGICRLLSGEALNGETERLYGRVGKIFERIEAQLKQVLREGEVREHLVPAITTSTAAALLMAAAEGKIRQYVRSGFSRVPTTDWADQFQLMIRGFFR